MCVGDHEGVVHEAEDGEEDEADGEVIPVTVGVRVVDVVIVAEDGVAVDELAREDSGDMLVFLSGEREIRETAEAHDVPIFENPPLARGIFASVEIDEFIKPEHFKAVAEIIAFVMGISKVRPRPMRDGDLTLPDDEG